MGWTFSSGLDVCLNVCLFLCFSQKHKSSIDALSCSGLRKVYFSLKMNQKAWEKNLQNRLFLLSSISHERKEIGNILLFTSNIKSLLDLFLIFK